jgi:hypothetical protein
MIRIRRALTLVVAVVAAVLLGASPAWAHGGPIELDVRSDGGQGITATAIYLRDHHFVELEVKMTYTAVNKDGKTIGPLPLKASAEGQSFYVSKDPLPTGEWTVTVTSSSPSAAQKTISVRSKELPVAGSATPPATPAGMSMTTLVAIPVAIAVVGGAVALFLRRRRQTTA